MTRGQWRKDSQACLALGAHVSLSSSFKLPNASSDDRGPQSSHLSCSFFFLLSLSLRAFLPSADYTAQICLILSFVSRVLLPESSLLPSKDSPPPNLTFQHLTDPTLLRTKRLSPWPPDCSTPPSQQPTFLLHTRPTLTAGNANEPRP